MMQRPCGGRKITIICLGHWNERANMRKARLVIYLE